MITAMLTIILWRHLYLQSDTPIKDPTKAGVLEDVPTAARVGRTKLDTERRGTINTINLRTLFSSKLENQWEALSMFSILNFILYL